MAMERESWRPFDNLVPPAIGLLELPSDAVGPIGEVSRMRSDLHRSRYTRSAGRVIAAGSGPATGCRVAAQRRRRDPGANPFSHAAGIGHGCSIRRSIPTSDRFAADPVAKSVELQIAPRDRRSLSPTLSIFGARWGVADSGVYACAVLLLSSSSLCRFSSWPIIANAGGKGIGVAAMLIIPLLMLIFSGYISVGWRNAIAVARNIAVADDGIAATAGRGRPLSRRRRDMHAAAGLASDYCRVDRAIVVGAGNEDVVGHS